MRYTLIASLFWFGLLGFDNFLPPVDTQVDTGEIYYLLLANGADNLTTPTGDQLITPQ